VESSGLGCFWGERVCEENFETEWKSIKKKGCLDNIREKEKREDQELSFFFFIMPRRTCWGKKWICYREKYAYLILGNKLEGNW
jgi:hypothetical protein